MNLILHKLDSLIQFSVREWLRSTSNLHGLPTTIINRCTACLHSSARSVQNSRSIHSIRIITVPIILIFCTEFFLLFITKMIVLMAPVYSTILFEQTFIVTVWILNIPWKWGYMNSLYETPDVLHNNAVLLQYQYFSNAICILNKRWTS